MQKMEKNATNNGKANINLCYEKKYDTAIRCEIKTKYLKTIKSVFDIALNGYLDAYEKMRNGNICLIEAVDIKNQVNNYFEQCDILMFFDDVKKRLSITDDDDWDDVADEQLNLLFGGLAEEEENVIICAANKTFEHCEGMINFCEDFLKA